MRIVSAAVVLGWCLALSGCLGGANTSPTKSDAGNGQDAGLVDAGLADAGLEDAGLVDAGQVDAGAADAGETLTVGNFCDKLVEKVCAQAVTCGCVAADAGTSCTSVQSSQCEQAFSAPAAGTVFGTTVFNAEEAELCLQAYLNSVKECAYPSANFERTHCLKMYAETVALGATCTGKFEGYSCAGGQGFCASDDKCTRYPKNGEFCINSICDVGLTCDDGKCVPTSPRVPKAAGSACVANFECDKGLGCISGVCASGSAVGETCSLTQDDTCASGLLCSAEPEKFCQDRLAENEPCQSNDCAAGLACVFVQFQPVCMKQVAAGASCKGNLPCVNEARCVSDVCTPLPTRGEACLWGECAAGFVCDDAQTCVDLGGEGDTCFRVDGCVSGFYCDMRGGMNGVCLSRVIEGDSCLGVDEACLGGLYCAPSSNVCAPFVAIGGSCASVKACGPSAECFFPQTGNSSELGTCQPLGSTLDAPCAETCGGDLRCAQKPATCQPGFCTVL